jgi:predicted DNA-binding protein with PD1-like motif
MRTKLLHESEGQRTFAVVLAPGEEVTECLLSFARENGIGAAAVSAIGALRRATVAFYDFETAEYVPIPLDEQLEVLTLAGDIALGDDDEPRLHLHAALGKRDGSAWGGHLHEAEVRPTLEAIVTESPPPLRRRVDPGSGLALLDLQPEDSG